MKRFEKEKLNGVRQRLILPRREMHLRKSDISVFGSHSWVVEAPILESWASSRLRCHHAIAGQGFIKPAQKYKQQQQLSETAKQSRKQFFLTLMRARKKIKCEIIFCVFPIGERGTPISSFSSLPTNDRRRRCNVAAVVTSCHAQLMFALKDTLSQKITK